MADTKTLPAILILEDGTIFNGTAFGKTRTATGGICFNTGITKRKMVRKDTSLGKYPAFFTPINTLFDLTGYYNNYNQNNFNCF